MTDERRRHGEKMKRIDAMAALGECYCDHEYMCRKHADEWHKGKP